MRKRLQILIGHAFPPYTWWGRAARRALPKALRSGVSVAYQRFIAVDERKLWAPPLPTTRTAKTKKRQEPLFSVVIPAFNTPDAFLRPLLDSLSNQTFGAFEAVIADASTDPARAAAIEQATQSDPRFHYLRLTDNKGIAANTNAALAHATAPYVVFADHDDVLSPHALNEMAVRITQDPSLDVLYSDEDVLSDDGSLRHSPFFKPAWSPHMFLECNYTNHLSVIRRSLVEDAGGLRPELDGAQDYDLLLRLHTRPNPVRVAHVPGVLYHWRQAPASTARHVETKNFAVDAGRQALTEYLQRVNVACDGIDDVPEQPGWYRIRPRWSVDVTVICTGAAASVADDLRRATKPSPCRPTWLVQPDGFDTSSLREADAVVLVSQPYLPDDPAWLDDLVGALALPGATAVAPLLAGPAGRVDTAGFAWDAAGVTNILFGNRVQGGNLNGPTRMVRDVDAVSRAVVAVKRADVDLLRSCLRQDDQIGVPTLVAVPPERGHAVVWAHQCMTRRDGLRRDGYVNANVGVGAMGWIATK